MSPYALIPFSIFFVCCIAQFALRGRIMRAMERHPEVLDRIPGSLMLGMGLHRFVMRGDHLRLGDESLNRHVSNYRRLLWVGLCACLGWVAFLVANAQHG